MVKEVLTILKLQLFGGYATPAPPVGPALGQHGVNLGQFCQQFNERTKRQAGEMFPVVITVYDDKSFYFEVMRSTTVCQLKKAAGIQEGSKQPGRERAGSITRDQLNEIAKDKMPDLNTSDLEAAARIIAGTARSMGIEIVG